MSDIENDLQLDGGFYLSEMVQAQRGFSDLEFEIFLATGQKPDLSQPPPEELERIDGDTQVMPLEDAAAWLAGGALTASSFFDFDPSHSVSPLYEVMRPKALRFDPRQPRDGDGQWSKIKSLLGKKKAKTDTTITSEYESAQRTLHSVTAVSTLGPEVERASVIYQQNGYRGINGDLRESYGKKVSDAARTLSDAMAPAKDNIVVHRAIARPQAMFGEHWNSEPGTNVGLEWVDHGFTSTTTRSSRDFLWDMISGEMSEYLYVVRVNVPAGTRALHLNAEDFSDESEILLDRGTRFRVTGDKVIDGSRVLDVEVVSQEASND